MGSLSITTAQRVSEAIKRLGACGAVIRETGLAATSLDRYVRFCKECSLLPDGIRLIGDRYFDTSEEIVYNSSKIDTKKEAKNLAECLVKDFGHCRPDKWD